MESAKCPPPCTPSENSPNSIGIADIFPTSEPAFFDVRIVSHVLPLVVAPVMLIPTAMPMPDAVPMQAIDIARDRTRPRSGDCDIMDTQHGKIDTRLQHFCHIAVF